VNTLDTFFCHITFFYLLLCFFFWWLPILILKLMLLDDTLKIILCLNNFLLNLKFVRIYYSFILFFNYNILDGKKHRNHFIIN